MSLAEDAESSGSCSASASDDAVELREKTKVGRELKKAKRRSGRGHVPTRTLYKERIMNNWHCTLDASLPIELRPRLRNNDEKRAAFQQSDKRRLPASHWSLAFLRALAKLSVVTMYDMDFAHQRLGKSVGRRQSNRTHSEYYAREALTSDITNVKREVRRLTSNGNYRPKQHLGLADVPPVLDAAGSLPGGHTARDTEEVLEDEATPNRHAQGTRSSLEQKDRDMFKVGQGSETLGSLGSDAEQGARMVEVEGGAVASASETVDKTVGDGTASKGEEFSDKEHGGVRIDQ